MFIDIIKLQIEALLMEQKIKKKKKTNQDIEKYLKKKEKKLY